MTVCAQCGQDKPAGRFRRRNTSLEQWCRQCEREHWAERKGTVAILNALLAGVRPALKLADGALAGVPGSASYRELVVANQNTPHAYSPGEAHLCILCRKHVVDPIHDVAQRSSRCICGSTPGSPATCICGALAGVPGGPKSEGQNLGGTAPRFPVEKGDK